MKPLRILGIESSCDDTSIALVEGNGENVRILKEASKSQIDIHKEFGGVVPEVAARAHSEMIMPLLKQVYSKKNPPDAIAVTSGPGLATALMVGVETARTLSFATGIPLISVNHIEGHMYSNWINSTPIQFPALCLVVSGGHTELILMKKHLSFKKLGATRDDAAGEAFDKAAKLLGFEYPGGPKISRAATDGNVNAIKFPRPMLSEPGYEFSFAGLKTSALYYVQKHPSLSVADFCASYEQAIVDVLFGKTVRAAKEFKVKSVLLCGGVAANKKLRATLEHEVAELGLQFSAPPIPLCMDNAAMIATAGYFKARAKIYTPWQKISANPQWEL